MSVFHLRSISLKGAIVIATLLCLLNIPGTAPHVFAACGGWCFYEYSIPTSGSQPYGITAGPDGNVWFTESNSNVNKIGRITPSGAITEFPLPFVSQPIGITAGPDGNLWFTEEGTNKIGSITTSGAITEFSLPTSGSQPWGITAGPDGNVWFTERGSNKIGHTYVREVCNSKGYCSFRTGIQENAVPTANSAPVGITDGLDGNLWFTEQSGNKIGRITPSGSITEFPIPTANSTPAGIAKAWYGGVEFTEYSGNRIGGVAPGNPVYEEPALTANSAPLGITAVPNSSTLWFTEQSGNKIGEMVPNIG